MFECKGVKQLSDRPSLINKIPPVIYSFLLDYFSQENAKPASAVTVNSENTVTHSSGGQSLKELSIVGQTASSDTQASGSKANHSEVVKGKGRN